MLSLCRRRVSIAWVSLLFLCPVTASGQSLRGRLVGSDDSLPVSNALVVLQDSLDERVRRTNTLSSGTFAFHSLGDGTYRLRVFRIGYAPWQSGDILVTGDGVLNLHIDLPSDPILLPDDIVVRGAGACRRDDGLAKTTGILIEEARKALALAEQTMTGSPMRFRVTSYIHELDPTGAIVKETTTASAPLRDWPIESAPVDTLAVSGFVRQPDKRNMDQGPTYYAPDGAALFSDWFLGAHCFDATRAKDDSMLVGLRFTPVEEGSQPGIEGVLWIGEASLALERLEFTYVRLPNWVPRGSAGGSMQFSQLPGGGWVVRRWWLRAPIEGRPVGRGSSRLAGFQEVGGRVVEIVDRRGKHLLWLDGE